MCKGFAQKTLPLKGRYRLLRFKNLFNGRNGPDGLSMALCYLACFMLVLNLFASGTLSTILWYLAFLILGIAYFRMFSRNISKRQLENARFLKAIDPFREKLARRKRRKAQKHLYCFFKCPSCGTVLRVPKGKGRIRITCKSCGHVFERTS